MAWLLDSSLHTLNTKVKHRLGSPDAASMKHFFFLSLRISSSWMLIRFHFADTLFATSFIRSDSSGSLSSPAYLLPEPASEESVKIPATVVRCYMVLPDGGRKQ